MIHLTSLEKEIVTAMQKMHRLTDGEGYLLLLILDYIDLCESSNWPQPHFTYKVNLFKYH